MCPNVINNDKYINYQNEIMKNIKEGKSLIKSSSQPEYKISGKLKLKPINVNNEIKPLINEEQKEKEKSEQNKKKKLKKKKTLDKIEKIDASQILENNKIN